MRQRLRQGCGEDGHGCSPQIQSFDVLTLLEMNKILELESLEGDSTGRRLSVSRRVGLLTIGEQSAVLSVQAAICNLKCHVNCAPGSGDALAESFKVIFMLVALRPYARFYPSHFLR
jgi:hypothetical protein